MAHIAPINNGAQSNCSKNPCQEISICTNGVKNPTTAGDIKTGPVQVSTHSFVACGANISVIRAYVTKSFIFWEVMLVL